MKVQLKLQLKKMTSCNFKVVYDDELVGEYDLISIKEVKKVNFFKIIKIINYLIWGDV